MTRSGWQEPGTKTPLATQTECRRVARDWAGRQSPRKSPCTSTSWPGGSSELGRTGGRTPGAGSQQTAAPKGEALSSGRATTRLRGARFTEKLTHGTRGDSGLLPLNTFPPTAPSVPPHGPCVLEYATSTWDALNGPCSEPPSQVAKTEDWANPCLNPGHPGLQPTAPQL